MFCFREKGAFGKLRPDWIVSPSPACQMHFSPIPSAIQHTPIGLLTPSYHLPTYLTTERMTDLLGPLVPNAPNNDPQCISSTENLLLRPIRVDWVKQVWGEYLRPIKRNLFLTNLPKVFDFASHQSPKGICFSAQRDAIGTSKICQNLSPFPTSLLSSHQLWSVVPDPTHLTDPQSGFLLPFFSLQLFFW